MRKTLALAILGTVAVANMAMAQGSIWFDNYSFAGYSQIRWSGEPGALVPPGLAGTPLVGDILLSYSFNAGANVGTLPIIPVADGYFQGGVVQIPGYGSGPVQITLQPRFNSEPLTGGVTFVEAGLATGTTPPAYFSGLPANGSWVVAQVPEPSTFALAGLGAAALLIFRRRA